MRANSSLLITNMNRHIHIFPRQWFNVKKCPKREERYKMYIRYISVTFIPGIFFLRRHFFVTDNIFFSFPIIFLFVSENIFLSFPTIFVLFPKIFLFVFKNIFFIYGDNFFHEPTIFLFVSKNFVFIYGDIFFREPTIFFFNACRQYFFFKFPTIFFFSRFRHFFSLPTIYSSLPLTNLYNIKIHTCMYIILSIHIPLSYFFYF